MSSLVMAQSLKLILACEGVAESSKVHPNPKASPGPLQVFPSPSQMAQSCLSEVTPVATCKREGEGSIQEEAPVSIPQETVDPPDVHMVGILVVVLLVGYLLYLTKTNPESLLHPSMESMWQTGTSVHSSFRTKLRHPALAMGGEAMPISPVPMSARWIGGRTAFLGHQICFVPFPLCEF